MKHVIYYNNKLFISHLVQYPVAYKGPWTCAFHHTDMLLGDSSSHFGHLYDMEQLLCMCVCGGGGGGGSVFMWECVCVCALLRSVHTCFVCGCIHACVAQLTSWEISVPCWAPL